VSIEGGMFDGGNDVAKDTTDVHSE